LYDRTNRCHAPSSEVVEGLLLQSKRQAKRIGCRHIAESIVNRLLQRSHVCNQNFILDVVVGMEALAARPDSIGLDAPALVRSEYQTKCRTQCLSNGELDVMHATVA